ncbi:FLYWCH zinc finger domain [Popillia japonica]|uniref:FLYWCH zinc finger domain n=1 Tax=Popillia japonica TaxID=7064 RepID=A0AAW1MLD7_POPJA
MAKLKMRKDQLVITYKYHTHSPPDNRFVMRHHNTESEILKRDDGGLWGKLESGGVSWGDDEELQRKPGAFGETVGRHGEKRRDFWESWGTVGDTMVTQEAGGLSGNDGVHMGDPEEHNFSNNFSILGTFYFLHGAKHPMLVYEHYKFKVIKRHPDSTVWRCVGYDTYKCIFYFCSGAKHHMLIYKDYKYKLVKKGVDYTIWRCVGYETHKCKSRLKTFALKDEAVIMNGFHTHDSVKKTFENCLYRRLLNICHKAIRVK